MENVTQKQVYANAMKNLQVLIVTSKLKRKKK